MANLALTILPLIPGFIGSVASLIAAVRDDDDTPAEVADKLAALSDRLDETAAEVAALEIRDV